MSNQNNKLLGGIGANRYGFKLYKKFSFVILKNRYKDKVAARNVL